MRERMTQQTCREMHTRKATLHRNHVVGVSFKSHATFAFAVLLKNLECIPTGTPRVEWRGLKIGGGNLIHRKVVFCIFRCKSI